MTNNAGILFVLVAVSLWATVGVAVELGPASPAMTPEFLAFARTSVGGLTILLAALLVLGPRALRVSRANLYDLTRFAMANAVFQIGLFWCFALLGVSITAFLTGCLPPVLAAAWDVLRRPRSLSGGTIASLGISVIGLGYIAGGGDQTQSDVEWRSGLAIAVLTSMAFIVMSQAAKSLGRSLQPVAAAGIGLTVSGGLLLVVALSTGSVPVPVIMAELSRPPVLGLFVFIGVVPTGLAFLLYCKGIAMCRSALVALIASMIRPAVATGLSVWLLSDKPTLAEAGGCALLILAMLVLWVSERNLARKQIARAQITPVAK